MKSSLVITLFLGASAVNALPTALSGVSDKERTSSSAEDVLTAESTHTHVSSRGSAIVLPDHYPGLPSSNAEDHEATSDIESGSIKARSNTAGTSHRKEDIPPFGFPGQPPADAGAAGDDVVSDGGQVGKRGTEEWKIPPFGFPGQPPADMDADA